MLVQRPDNLPLVGFRKGVYHPSGVSHSFPSGRSKAYILQGVSWTRGAPVQALGQQPWLPHLSDGFLLLFHLLLLMAPECMTATSAS